jgi:SAM-dependent methyltransferase
MLPSEVDVPYPAWPIPEAAPTRIAAMVGLAGWPAPAPASYRMLELGCASAGNLLPLACSYPGAQFVGVDLDATEIAVAVGFASQLGLDNLRLLPMSVESVVAELRDERFDYIVAHGLYSWVPERAREALMQVCGTLLAEHGVAYISYNTQPGFELREMVRDALAYHCRNASSASQAVREARPFLETLLASPLAAVSPLVRNELAASAKAHDARLVYDDLGETYAFDFDDVVAHAARHGLAFLSEAVPTAAHVRSFGGNAGRRLSELAGDRLAQESLLDLLMLRRFRRSLFHKPADSAQANSAPLLDELHVLAQFERPELSSLSQSWTIPGIAGAKLTIDSPQVRAALWVLGKHYPSTVPILTLRAEASQLAAAYARTSERQDQALDRGLVALFEAGILELLGAPIRCGSTNSRPTAFPYASLAATTGRPISNLHHRQPSLSAAASHLLPLLDGSKATSELAAVLARPAQEIEKALG